MTEQDRNESRGRLDEAVDRTVHELMNREAPGDLRARVLTRLAERPTSSAERRTPNAGWLRTPQRLAWTGAALAVIVAVALMVPRWRERSESSVVGTRATPLPPASGEGTPALVTAQSPTQPGEPAPFRRTTLQRAAAAAWSEPDRAPFIDPLPAPEPIAIAALETEHVTPERIDIAPLRFDTVQIEPIQVQR